MDIDRRENAKKATENMSGVWSTGIFHVSRNRNTKIKDKVCDS